MGLVVGLANIMGMGGREIGKLCTRSVLKGHGFSRAEGRNNRVVALATEGM
jgi:hypothetical protein